MDRTKNFSYVDIEINLNVSTHTHKMARWGQAMSKVTLKHFVKLESKKILKGFNVL